MMELDDDDDGNVDPRRAHSRNSNDERVDDDERRDGGGRQDAMMEQDYEQIRYQAVRPWYMPGWLGNNRNSNHPSRTLHQHQRVRAASPKDGFVLAVDDREQQDGLQQQREMGNGNSHMHYDARTHEPLKRATGGGNSSEDESEDRGIKRRRLTEQAAMGYYHYAVPVFGERGQTIIEYTAPASFTPLLKIMGYTPFAVHWVMVMYTCHFVQTAFSTFGPETKDLRIQPWITPYVHHLMDTYIWNHSMITCMLLDPERFGGTAYWLACFFTMAQQQVYLSFSLKCHYMRHKDSLVHLRNDPAKQRQLEVRFFDIFLLYALADVLFIAARLLDIRVLLYIGLVEFNLCPLYLMWAYKKRMEQAGLDAKKNH